jgi:hypothetical protein
MKVCEVMNGDSPDLEKPSELIEMIKNFSPLWLRFS